jgi:iron complex outermembrane receptor protein
MTKGWKQGTAIVGVAATVMAGSVSAQDEGLGALTDVVTVTATKRPDPENVQDVPLAVTAFDEESLEALKVRDLTDLGFSAPNVALEDIGTVPGTANFAIRGLGINSSIPSIDPAVGVFLDGVYLGVNAGVVLDLFDIESVEILRGPQGLLFGRNTTGGAVVVNTSGPTDTFRARGRVAYEAPLGDDRGGPRRIASGSLSGPILPGRLNGKVGAYLNDDEGYFENRLDGSSIGESFTYSLRGALEFTPSETLTVLGKLDFTRRDGDGAISQNRGLFERDSFDVSLDEPGFADIETLTFSLRSDLDVGFGDGRITKIMGYRTLEQATRNDIDSGPERIFVSDTGLDQDQVSGELRYAGTFGRTELTTGLYGFHQDAAYFENRDLTALGAPFSYGGGTQEHTVLGIFGQADHHLTDTLALSLGLRLTREEKESAVTFVRPRPECSPIEGTCPTEGENPFAPGEPNGFRDRDEWSNLIPKIGLAYEPADTVLLYTHWTKGYRSGGYNLRATNPALFVETIEAGGEPSFDEEEVRSFEIGGKFETADGRGQLNLALFRTKIEDMQREVNLSSPTAGVSQFILNTADATIEGIEAEGQWRVGESLLLRANLGLIDAGYDRVLFDISSDDVVDRDDLALAIPRVPEATYGASVLHEADLRERGSLLTRVSFQHRDRVAYTDNNFGWIQAADMLDANLTWQPRDGRVALSLYGRNLLDEVQAGGDTQLPFGGPLSSGVAQPFGADPAGGTFSPLMPGRVIGVELRMSR